MTEGLYVPTENDPIPFVKRKTGGREPNPLDAYVEEKIKDLQRAGSVFISKSNLSMSKSNEPGKRINLVIKNYTAQMKGEGKEVYFEYKTIRDGNKEPLGIKISRLV